MTVKSLGHKSSPDKEPDNFDMPLVICFSEVVEHTCSITSLQMGETMQSVTKDMDTYSYRVPLGVCAGITP